MVIGRINGDKHKGLLLGLTAENIKRLQQGQPIKISQLTHGMAVPYDLEICIMYGDTMEDIRKELTEAGLIGDKTRIVQSGHG